MKTPDKILKAFKDAQIPPQSEIIANWVTALDKPKVSIRCLAYNHEDFIEDTLKGFLIQKTTFPFEILIHDDASTDRTAEVLRKYEEKYPAIIKVVYQTKNQYSQGIKPISYLHAITKGEYIAACEGDDFWTDPNKLAIQAKYLDENPDVVISVHDAMIIDSDEKVISASKLDSRNQRDFDAKELQQCKPLLLTLSWMYRNVPIPNIPERARVTNGDTFLISVLGAFGGSHYHKDIENAVYRAHSGGVWSELSRKSQHENLMNTYFNLSMYYRRMNKEELSFYFYELFLNRLSLTIPFRKGIYLLKRYFINFIKSTLKRS